MELFAKIERCARKHPDRPAHIGVDAEGARRTLTYQQLVTRAACLAAYLRRTLPHSIRFVSNMSLTANGKIDRRKLVEEAGSK